LNPKRFYGLLSAAAAGYGYSNFAVLATAYNPTVVTLGIGALAFSFLRSFSSRNQLDTISFDESSGLLNISYKPTLAKSVSIKANIGAIRNIGVFQHAGQL
jgi:hypothetical protein